LHLTDFGAQFIRFFEPLPDNRVAILLDATGNHDKTAICIYDTNKDSSNYGNILLQDVRTDLGASVEPKGIEYYDNILYVSVSRLTTDADQLLQYDVTNKGAESLLRFDQFSDTDSNSYNKGLQFIGSDTLLGCSNDGGTSKTTIYDVSDPTSVTRTQDGLNCVSNVNGYYNSDKEYLYNVAGYILNVSDKNNITVLTQDNPLYGRTAERVTSTSDTNTVYTDGNGEIIKSDMSNPSSPTTFNNGCSPEPDIGLYANPDNFVYYLHNQTLTECDYTDNLNPQTSQITSITHDGGTNLGALTQDNNLYMGTENDIYQFNIETTQPTTFNLSIENVTVELEDTQTYNNYNFDRFNDVINDRSGQMLISLSDTTSGVFGSENYIILRQYYTKGSSTTNFSFGTATQFRERNSTTIPNSMNWYGDIVTFGSDEYIELYDGVDSINDISNVNRYILDLNESVSGRDFASQDVVIDEQVNDEYRMFACMGRIFNGNPENHGLYYIQYNSTSNTSSISFVDSTLYSCQDIKKYDGNVIVNTGEIGNNGILVVDGNNTGATVTQRYEVHNQVYEQTVDDTVLTYDALETGFNGDLSVSSNQKMTHLQDSYNNAYQDENSRFSCPANEGVTGIHESIIPTSNQYEVYFYGDSATLRTCYEQQEQSTATFDHRIHTITFGDNRQTSALVFDESGNAYVYNLELAFTDENNNGIPDGQDDDINTDVGSGKTPTPEGLTPLGSIFTDIANISGFASGTSLILLSLIFIGGTAGSFFKGGERAGASNNTNVMLGTLGAGISTLFFYYLGWLPLVAMLILIILCGGVMVNMTSSVFGRGT
jgi:hypothetical protein